MIGPHPSAAELLTVSWDGENRADLFQVTNLDVRIYAIHNPNACSAIARTTKAHDAREEQACDAAVYVASLGRWAT